MALYQHAVAMTLTSAAKPLVIVDVERPRRAEQAISQAIHVVSVFSERHPHDGKTANPWKNPLSMLEKFDHARARTVAASQCQKNDINDDTDKDPAAFVRDVYMNLISNSFADVLEDTRNSSGSSEEELDVDVLLDCLHSGMDCLSGEEKEFLIMGNSYNEDEEHILEENSTRRE